MAVAGAGRSRGELDDHLTRHRAVRRLHPPVGRRLAHLLAAVHGNPHDVQLGGLRDRPVRDGSGPAASRVVSTDRHGHPRRLVGDHGGADVPEVTGQ